MIVCAITSDMSFMTSYSKRVLTAGWRFRNSTHWGIGIFAVRTLVTPTIE